MEKYEKREYFFRNIFQKKKILQKLFRVAFLNFIMKNHNMLHKTVFIEHIFPLKKDYHKKEISNNIFEFLSISNTNTIDYIIEGKTDFSFLNFCVFIVYNHFCSVIKILNFLNF